MNSAIFLSRMLDDKLWAIDKNRDEWVRLEQVQLKSIYEVKA